MKEGQNNINQTVSGENNQVAGRDIIIQANPEPDDKPSPDNPNLIRCPACHRFGVFRGAELCPYCNYSFLKARRAEQEKVKLKAHQRMSALSLLAVVTFSITVTIADKFSVGLLKGFGWAILIVFVLYFAGSWCWARLNAWLKYR